MELNLKGKRVLVTGGTRGIGRAIVDSFVREGSIVGFCARTESHVRAVEEQYSSSECMLSGSVLDISSFGEVKRWVDGFVSDFGWLDILISNVSAQSFDWRDSFQVDILSCVNLIDLASPYLKQSAYGGSIVAISSKAALLSVPSYKPYSAMKAALISYMSSLSREMAPFGVRANTISPGEIYFPGGFWERIKNEDPELYENTLKTLPSGRFGTPQEVASAVLFLSSSASSFVSGANLIVDGAGRDHVQF